MKPAAFAYVRADTLATGLEALAAPDARALAGGQSLVPLMNLRLARPETLVDINGLSELDSVQVDNGDLVLGALCRHRRLELDPTVLERAPLLAEAVALVGHPAIRNRGTIGGNLAHGDPAAELGAALLALDGKVTVRSASSSRQIKANDLFTGFFSTAVGDGELITEVTVPARSDHEGTAFVEFAPRRGDFAVVGIAARVVLDESGRCQSAHAAACGVAATPVDLGPALENLVGLDHFTDDALGEAAQAIPSRFEATADLQASAQDRRELTQLLTVEALRRAWGRAGSTLQ